MSSTTTRQRAPAGDQSTAEIIRHNREKIESMKQSNKRITEELRAQEKRSKIMFRDYQARVDRLQAIRLETLQKVEQKHVHLARLEEDYSAAMKEFKERRLAQAKIDGESHQSLNKQILMKKSDNQKLKIKLNEYSAEIKLQREKINALRKERTLLDKMYSKLELSIKKKMRDYLRLIELTEDKRKVKNRLTSEMKEIEQTATKQISSIEKKYQSVMESTTEELLAINGKARASKEEGDDGSVFDSQVLEERDFGPSEELLLGEEHDFLNGKDPKEVELAELTRLFDKLKLLTELEDYQKIKQYYENGDAKNQELYDAILENEKRLEKALQEKKQACAVLEKLKSKEKTLEEMIDEDKVGYEMAREIVDYNHRKESLEKKSEDLVETIGKLNTWIDEIKVNVTEEVDSFWNERIEKLKSTMQDDATDKQLEKEEMREKSTPKQEASKDQEEEAEKKEEPKPEEKEAEQEKPKEEEQPKKDAQEEDKPKEESPKEEQAQEKAEETKEEEKQEAKEAEKDKEASKQEAKEPEKEEEASKQEEEEQQPEEARQEEPNKDLEVPEPTPSEEEALRQSRIEEIKKAEFKADIIELAEKEERVTDPALLELEEKVNDYKSLQEKVTDKVTYFEKLTEDVELLTNFLRNKKINLSEISILKKRPEAKEREFKAIESDIYQISYEYYEGVLKTSDELITKDMNKLRSSTQLEVIEKIDEAGQNDVKSKEVEEPSQDL